MPEKPKTQEKDASHESGTSDASPRNAARLDNQLCFAVHAAAHAFNRAYRPLLDRIGLTYPQYLAMLALWEEDEITVKALGEQLFLDSGTLSPLLKRMEQAGLLQRRRDGRDERQVLVTLTQKGRDLRQETAHVMPSLLAKTGCSLGEAEDLKTRLHALRAMLDG